jgi:hypothetical protein
MSALAARLDAIDRLPGGSSFIIDDLSWEREISESRFLPGLTPSMLARALEHSKTEGQTATLRAFRQERAAESPA